MTVNPDRAWPARSSSAPPLCLAAVRPHRNGGMLDGFCISARDGGRLAGRSADTCCRGPRLARRPRDPFYGIDHGRRNHSIRLSRTQWARSCGRSCRNLTCARSSSRKRAQSVRSSSETNWPGGSGGGGDPPSRFGPEFIPHLVVETGENSVVEPQAHLGCASRRLYDTWFDLPITQTGGRGRNPRKERELLLAGRPGQSDSTPASSPPTGPTDPSPTSACRGRRLMYVHPHREGGGSTCHPSAAGSGNDPAATPPADGIGPVRPFLTLRSSLQR